MLIGERKREMLSIAAQTTSFRSTLNTERPKSRPHRASFTLSFRDPSFTSWFGYLVEHCSLELLVKRQDVWTHWGQDLAKGRPAYSSFDVEILHMDH
jgi:hypothetical protein